MMPNAPIASGETVQEREERPASVEVEPYRWALSPWARAYRRLAKPIHVTRHVKRFCHPFSIDGAEKLGDHDQPMLVIANHTSHFDTVIVLSVLPNRIYDRLAIVAAADRMYRDKVKGMWHSLRYNAFPISRGGGRRALAYSQWLLHKNWSLLIFPEGARSRTGELLPFHPGPAILALSESVPVLPIHIKGAHDILPPGEKYSRPAAVSVHVGDLLTFPQGTDVAAAKEAMENAMRALASAA
jgi:1-acyl-sn-glycerol-3-phosphate acyltransferase